MAGGSFSGSLTGTKMKSFSQLNLLPVTVGTLLILAAAGCGRDNVKVYHADASDTATLTPPPLAASGAMPTAMPDGICNTHCLPAGRKKT